MKLFVDLLQLREQFFLQAGNVLLTQGCGLERILNHAANLLDRRNRFVSFPKLFLLTLNPANINADPYSSRHNHADNKAYKQKIAFHIASFHGNIRITQMMISVLIY